MRHDLLIFIAVTLALFVTVLVYSAVAVGARAERLRKVPVAPSKRSLSQLREDLSEAQAYYQFVLEHQRLAPALDEEAWEPEVREARRVLEIAWMRYATHPEHWAIPMGPQVSA